MLRDSTYKLAAKNDNLKRSQIQIGNVIIGGDEIVVIAGPCAIESLDSLRKTAKEVKDAGAKIMRASAFKPRTSPYSFQGLGLEGLKIHRQVADEFDLIIETEVMDPRLVDQVASYVDILRIGSRNMQNFELLKEVGRQNKPVILKRGLAATIDEWLNAAEYIMHYGNSQVILCERGIRTFETAMRNTLDLSAVAYTKQITHLPIIVDPSHACGIVNLIKPLSRAAIATGADGLLIEVHHNPKEALCDGHQALLPHQFESLMQDCKKVAISVDRTLSL